MENRGVICIQCWLLNVGYPNEYARFYLAVSGHLKLIGDFVNAKKKKKTFNSYKHCNYHLDLYDLSLYYVKLQPLSHVELSVTNKHFTWFVCKGHLN